MYRTLFTALAVAASLGWGLPIAAGQQQDTSPGGTYGQPGAAATPGTSGTAASGTATADPAKLQTYIQMRKFLQSQVFSVVPADLSQNRETLDRLLKSQNRQWMTTDEFIEFHRQVQTDPALRAMVEAEMEGGATGASGSTGQPGPTRR